MNDELAKAPTEKRCPNPYCDGTGWIRVDATANTQAYQTPACKLGPHQSTKAALAADAGEKGKE